MYTSKWNIGIDLYQSKIQLVAAKRRKKHWSLCECWQQQLPFEIADKSDHEQYKILLNILIQWRQKLPKNCSVSIALPAVRTLKQQFALPSQINLQQPELGWYLQLQAEKRFPMHAQELAMDYRVINQHVYFNGARKSEINFWQKLLAESGFNLLAIDVAPVALRYVARHAGLPDESWLVHYRQGEWLWSGLLVNPPTITIYPTPKPRCYLHYCLYSTKKSHHRYYPFTSLPTIKTFMINIALKQYIAGSYAKLFSITILKSPIS